MKLCVILILMILKKKEVILPDNKSLPEHLFKFKQCEILFDKESIYQILDQIEK